MVEQKGIEPSTSALRNRPGEIPPGGTEAQVVGNIGLTQGSESTESPGLAAKSSSLVPVVSPESGDKKMRRCRVLGVREVAEMLGVCTATVYKLCERGELGHLRVSNAIRIAREDLDAYLERVRCKAR